MKVRCIKVPEARTLHLDLMDHLTVGGVYDTKTVDVYVDAARLRDWCQFAGRDCGGCEVCTYPDPIPTYYLCGDKGTGHHFPCSLFTRANPNIITVLRSVKG